MQVFAARVEGLDGEWEQAAALLRAAGEASGRHGDTLAASAAAAGLARSLLEQGRAADALDAAGAVAVTGDPLVDAEVSGVRARGLAVAGRDFPAAVRAARHACAVAAETDSVACLATAELDRALVLHAARPGGGGRPGGAGRAAAVRRQGAPGRRAAVGNDAGPGPAPAGREVSGRDGHRLSHPGSADR